MPKSLRRRAFRNKLALLTLPDPWPDHRSRVLTLLTLAPREQSEKGEELCQSMSQ